MKNPKLIVKPFAKNGQKNVIPENYETSMESNQATWDQGFGQITMLPVAAGGLPPKGQDFNGIFNQISENIVYLSQGGRFKFSAEYAEAIGGYPKGAILQSDDEKKEYLSLIDNNKVDFNTATDISASWKLVNTDDLLAQIASKQPKGDYATKTELNSGLAGKQPVGDYATKTEVNSKLAKDQNGADIPNKDTFIKNLGLPEKYQPKGNYAVTNAAATQLFTGPVISSDTVGAQNTDGKLKSFLFISGGAAPAWGATVNGGYAGALKHPLKDGTAATTDDVNAVKGLALGVGQAWQIVTRGNGATNTNNTGRTITVNVIRYTGVRGRVSVNGISVAAFRGGRTDTSPTINVDMTVTAIVPPGAKYIISWDKDVADAGEPEIVELR